MTKAKSTWLEGFREAMDAKVLAIALEYVAGHRQYYKTLPEAGLAQLAAEMLLDAAATMVAFHSPSEGTKDELMSYLINALDECTDEAKQIRAESGWDNQALNVIDTVPDGTN